MEGGLDNLIFYVGLTFGSAALAWIANNLKVVRGWLPSMPSVVSFGIFFFAIIGALALVRAAYRPSKRWIEKRRKITRSVARETEIDFEGIMLSDARSVSFPDDRAQEYNLTVINESGADITECYVVLDESALRFDESDEWELEQVKLIDAPFRWNKMGVSPSGRLDIEDGDRASFTLGRSIQYWVTDAKTKKNAPLFQFRLTLHGQEDTGGGYELLVNYFYRLLIAIRAKDKNGRRLPDVRYDLYVRPTESTGPLGGLDVYDQVRRSERSNEE